MNSERAIKVLFLITPYIHLIKSLSSEYKKSDALTFIEVAGYLIKNLTPEDFTKITSLLLDISEEDAKDVPISDIIINLPKIIVTNRLIELYDILVRLGLE